MPGCKASLQKIALYQLPMVLMLWLLGVNLTAYREFCRPSVLIHHRHSLFIKWTLLCFSHKVMEVTMASCSTNCLTEYKMALQKCHSPALIYPTLYQRKGWHLLTTEACLILKACLWLIITVVTMSWELRMPDALKLSCGYLWIIFE